MKLVVDVGGTSIRSALFDGDNMLPITKHSSKDRTLDLMLDELIRSSRPQSVNVSFAGQVDNGTIYSSPNIDLGSLTHKNFNSWTQEHFGISGKIDNDLLCVALAEMEAERCDNMAIFYIGTGFGAAFVVDGKLLRGAKNLAGEIGHIPYKRAPFVCGCGKDDCVELFCSGKALESWCKRLNLPLISIDLMPSNPNYNQIYYQFMEAFAHIISTTVAMLNPQTIILGGGVGKSQVVLNEAKAAIKRSFKPAQSIVIKQSSLDEFANLIGANKL